MKQPEPEKPQDSFLPLRLPRSARTGSFSSFSLTAPSRLPHGLGQRPAASRGRWTATRSAPWRCCVTAPGPTAVPTCSVTALTCPMSHHLPSPVWSLSPLLHPLSPQPPWLFSWPSAFMCELVGHGRPVIWVWGLKGTVAHLLVTPQPAAPLNPSPFQLHHKASSLTVVLAETPSFSWPMVEASSCQSLTLWCAPVISPTALRICFAWHEV